MIFVAVQAFLLKVSLHRKVLKIPHGLMLFEKGFLFSNGLHLQGVQKRFKKLMCKLILFLPFRKLQRLVGDLEDYAYNAHERERKQSEGGEVRNAEEEFPDGQQQADVAVELRYT